MNTKHSLYCGIIFLLAFLGGSCQGEVEKSEEKNCLTEQDIRDLEPLSVINSQVEKELRFNGKVTYDPKSVIRYTSFVSGVITNTYFNLGDKVTKGQVLAEIKSTELNEMQSEVAQLKEKLRVAERELEKTQGFHQHGIASEKELMKAKGERNNLASQLKRLQDNLAFYSVSVRKNVFEIKAPKTGFVIRNKLVDGLQISDNGKSLFTISNLDKVWVELSVYATDMDMIEKGMPVEIKTNSYPDTTFSAKIDWVSQVINPAKNILKAVVVFENDRLKLKPGLQVEVIAKAKNKHKAPRIPAKAVVFHNNEYFVDVIDSCQTQNRHIQILAQDENTVFVKHGLEPGEKIVTKNALLHFEEQLSEN